MAKCPYKYSVYNSGKSRSRQEYTGHYLSGQEVPCGRCSVCRRNRGVDWATRLIHESYYHRKMCFLTLTYRDELLPHSDFHIPTLVKRHWQLFIKRLRKRTGAKIKYFAVGEYTPPSATSPGERPHYHAIIFGWEPDLFDLEPVKGGYFSSKTIQDLWYADLGFGIKVPYGFNTVGTVTPKSMFYVSGYILKANLRTNNLMGRQREFLLCSQGLGKQYALDNKEDLLDNNFRIDGKRVAIPRYYIKRINLYNDKPDNKNDLEKYIQGNIERSQFKSKITLQNLEKEELFLKKHIGKSIDDFTYDDFRSLRRKIDNARLQNEMNVNAACTISAARKQTSDL